MFAPDIEIPYADSWTAGIQRKLSTNMAVEIRYVGTLSRDLWQARNFNEINIFENDSSTSSVPRRRNLLANIAAGPGRVCRGVTTANCQNNFALHRRARHLTAADPGRILQRNASAPYSGTHVRRSLRIRTG